jgi:hypothetical protein
MNEINDLLTNLVAEGVGYQQVRAFNDQFLYN